MANSLQRIQAAVVDGRSRAPRYIQTQLTVLYDALVKLAPNLHQAIVRDTGCSAQEAWIEIHMTIQAVRNAFGSINFEGALEKEYNIAHGKDSTSRRVPIGCVYIIPSQHTRLYSIVQPVATAILAGNCIVLEMRQTLLEVEKLLRETLSKQMDKDTFTIVDQRPASDKFFSPQVLVVNASSEQTATSFGPAKQLNSNTSRTVAIVDRSANIADAAKNIVRARFRFAGRSPYAPDIVLVNEFAMKEFCQAAVRSLTEDLSEAVSPSRTNRAQKLGSNEQGTRSPRSESITTLISSASGTIQLIKQRSKDAMSKKVSERVLYVNAITSLDDAIDTANNSNNPLLSLYLFAAPAAAKYLSQFIAADVSFVNQIPSHLLVGPPAPHGHVISLRSRYTQEMFSLPSPEFIRSIPEDTALTQILDGSASKSEIDKLKADIKTPLPDMKQPSGKSIGFFEQGLITGVSIELSIVVAVVAVAARYSVPAIMRQFK